MTRTLRITYSLSFLGLLVGMGVWSTGGLQSFQRTEQMTLLNGKLAKAAETHYDEQFPIKRLGTNQAVQRRPPRRGAGPRPVAVQ